MERAAVTRAGNPGNVGESWAYHMPLKPLRCGWGVAGYVVSGKVIPQGSRAVFKAENGSCQRFRLSAPAP